MEIMQLLLGVWRSSQLYSIFIYMLTYAQSTLAEPGGGEASSSALSTLTLSCDSGGYPLSLLEVCFGGMLACIQQIVIELSDDGDPSSSLCSLCWESVSQSTSTYQSHITQVYKFVKLSVTLPYHNEHLFLQFIPCCDILLFISCYVGGGGLLALLGTPSVVSASGGTFLVLIIFTFPWVWCVSWQGGIAWGLKAIS